MPGRYFIKTFGCQMNEYDSARMADALHAAQGLTATDDPAQADILLMTSNWEAYPLAMLEAMAAGTLWVSFDVGNAREMSGGIVVESASEMAAVVLDLLNDPDRARQLGADGQAQIAARHHWETIVDQYEDLYQTVARSKCAARLQEVAS